MMSHEYRDMPADMQEELFSNFLIDSWSYSKVSTFSRNELDFERTYIYGQRGRVGASNIAGQAYHEALQKFFDRLKEDNTQLGIVDMQDIGYSYIEDVSPNRWKIQKTTPTVEECRKKAIKDFNKLIENFVSERELYLKEIQQVEAVEIYLDEFVTINGVDIPLPVHMKLDLVIKTKEGKRVIIDHKSKASYSDEKELKFTGSKQAITYVIGLETNSAQPVDEVWFVENKYSKNRDGSPQLACHKIIIDVNTRRLYEALLYEPLRRMIEAVSNPDYVYLINDNDAFVDKAELYEFWAQTQISEVDSFHIPESKKELVSKRLKKIRDSSLAHIDPKTIKTFQDNASHFIQFDLSTANMTPSEKIEHLLKTFGLNTSVAHVVEGYSSDSYLLEVSAGNSINSINRYKLDIASALNVSNVRINKELTIHNGRSYLSIESPKHRDKILYFDPKYLQGRKIPIGLDNFGNTIIWDLDNHSTPHMLVCGATGSGKSALIISMLGYAELIGFDNIVIFDPKYEFASYQHPKVQVFSDIEEIEETIEKLVAEMQDFAKSGYKTKTLVVFDEFADAVSQSKSGKELDIKEMVEVGQRKVKTPFGDALQPKMELRVTGTKKSLEENLKILLQKGRSIGYRIVAATQRASVKVITGDAKVNFPVQICFRVPKEIDSKVVLDEAGAESLSGMGDGLINSPEYLGIRRFQSFFKPNF